MILRKNQNITTSLDKCELQLTEADAQDDTTQDTARESRLNVKLVHQNGRIYFGSSILITALYYPNLENKGSPRHIPCGTQKPNQPVLYSRKKRDISLQSIRLYSRIILYTFTHASLMLLLNARLRLSRSSRIGTKTV